MTRYCGRVFSAHELALIRELIAEDPTRTRADLSRLACQRLPWYKAAGGMKEMSCRVAMLRMQADGPSSCRHRAVKGPSAVYA